MPSPKPFESWKSVSGTADRVFEVYELGQYNQDGTEPIIVKPETETKKTKR